MFLLHFKGGTIIKVQLATERPIRLTVCFKDARIYTYASVHVSIATVWSTFANLNDRVHPKDGEQCGMYVVGWSVLETMMN